MKGRAFLLKIKFSVFLVVLIRAESPTPCELEHSDKDRWPHLIRVARVTEGRYVFVTLAHGTLISADKVLSTCLDVDRKDLEAGKYRLIGHNVAKKCLQMRNTTRLHSHPGCFPSRTLVQFDFALWTPSEDFDVLGFPFLWRDNAVIKPELTKHLISEMHRDGGQLKVTVFYDGLVQADANLHYRANDLHFSQEFKFVACKQLLSESEEPREHFFNFFCGSLSHASNSTAKDLLQSWYSGAVIDIVLNEDTLTIGMVSRTTVLRRGRGSSVNVAFLREFYRFLHTDLANNSRLFATQAPLRGCMLSGFSHYPFLMRIIKRLSTSIIRTVGHGSLVRVDKVLTTCSPYRQLPVSLKNDDSWEILGYSNIMRCTARRQPSKIIKHPDCMHRTISEISVHDFAVWSPVEDFLVDGEITLWGREYPLSIKTVRAEFNVLKEEGGTGQMAAFDSPYLQSFGLLNMHTQVFFLSLNDCIHLINGTLEPIRMNLTDAASPIAFCGWQRRPGRIQENKSDEWYTGAPISFWYEHTDNRRGNRTFRVFLGIVSQTFNIPSFAGFVHLFVGFDEDFKVFLDQNFAGRISGGEEQNVWLFSFQEKAFGNPAIVVGGIILSVIARRL